mmetsp:Transcript_22377/g.62812  ORF Transcript_22377/g.62812 Transcript_22377/m.62812 type:complete len:283 (-) Transcript_22377:15-863(-)
MQELREHHAAEVRDDTLVQSRVVAPVDVAKKVCQPPEGLLVSGVLHGHGGDTCGQALQLADARVARVEVYVDWRVLAPQRVVAQHLAERALARESAAADEHAWRRQVEVVGPLPPLLEHRRTAEVVPHDHVRRVVLLHGGPAHLDPAAMPCVDGRSRAPEEGVVLAGNELGAENLRTVGHGLARARGLLLQLRDQLHPRVLVVVDDDPQLAARAQLLDAGRGGVMGVWDIDGHQRGARHQGWREYLWQPERCLDRDHGGARPPPRRSPPPSAPMVACATYTA